MSAWNRRVPRVTGMRPDRYSLIVGHRSDRTDRSTAASAMTLARHALETTGLVSCVRATPSKYSDARRLVPGTTLTATAGDPRAAVRAAGFCTRGDRRSHFLPVDRANSDVSPGPAADLAPAALGRVRVRLGVAIPDERGVAGLLVTHGVSYPRWRAVTYEREHLERSSSTRRSRSVVRGGGPGGRRNGESREFPS